MQAYFYSYFKIYIKIAETLVITEFPLSLHHERAGIRTPDNLIKSQVLYQLSYTPILLFFCQHFIADKMPRAGIEPATRGFSVLCSTN